MRGLGIGHGLLWVALLALGNASCSRGDISTDDGRDISTIGKPSESDDQAGASQDAAADDDLFRNSNDRAMSATDAGPPSDGVFLEHCGDGIDNDGDGLADEGCACQTAAMQRCYSGPSANAGIGSCAFGTQSCDTSGEFAVWGECADWVAPETEACNAKDDDCDGSIDEGCECKLGFHRACFSGDARKRDVGQCQAGSQTCEAGSWGACEDEVLPSDEECDGLDNNCNGQVDEGCSCDDGEQRACFDGSAREQGLGECKAGLQICEGMRWGSCQGQVLPKEEACDGLDNDCDGTVDGLARSCYSGAQETKNVGQCKAGAERCEAGAWGECSGEVLPTDEECDRDDNDCDSKTDEGLSCTVVPPEPGTDIVVFNDINVFDVDSMAVPDNPQLVENLVDYTTAAERNDADTVWMDYGHGSQCSNTSECNATRMATMYSTMQGIGYTVTEVTTYASIPDDVKVIILWNPLEAYTLDQINMYKQFAAEGGRLVFIGEHDAYYTGLAIENAFLLNMGAVMTNVGGQIDCSYFDVPTISIRPHQITTGVDSIRIACSSQIVLGPTDYPLYYDTTNTMVLSGVATIDTTPAVVLIQP